MTSFPASNFIPGGLEAGGNTHMLMFLGLGHRFGQEILW